MDCLVIRIGESQVTVARFNITGKSVAMEGAALFELNAGQDLAAVAGRITSGVKESPRVVLCLPPSLFAHKVVDLPLTDPQKIREVLPAQLLGEIALPVETAVFDALKLPAGKVLTLWAQKKDIANAIGLFKEAGMEPEVVTSSLFGWPSLPGIPHDCALFDGNSLAIITGGELTFFRALSGAEPVKQLITTLSALEMSAAMLPSRLFVFGLGVVAPQLPDTLSIAVETLEPSEDCVVLFRTVQNFHQLADLYAVARSCYNGSLPDFRRGDLAWTAGDVLLRRKLRLTALLAAVVVLLLFTGKALQYQSASRDIDSLNASIARIYSEIFPKRTKAVDEVAEVRGEIRKLTGSETSCAVLDTLKQLAEAKGAAINGLYEAELEGKVLRLKGDARSAQSVNEFKAGVAPFMTAVEVGEVRSRADGGVTFSMTATLKEGIK